VQYTTFLADFLVATCPASASLKNNGHELPGCKMVADALGKGNSARHGLQFPVGLNTQLDPNPGKSAYRHVASCPNPSVREPVYQMG